MTQIVWNFQPKSLDSIRNLARQVCQFDIVKRINRILRCVNHCLRKLLHYHLNMLTNLYFEFKIESYQRYRYRYHTYVPLPVHTISKISFYLSKETNQIKLLYVPYLRNVCMNTNLDYSKHFFFAQVQHKKLLLLIHNIFHISILRWCSMHWLSLLCH